MAYVPVTVSDEQLSQLEEHHEDILVLRGSERAPWLLVVKRPNRQQTIAYKQHAKKDSTTANEALFRHITVFPAAKDPDFDRQLNRWPLLCDAAAGSESFADFLGTTVNEQVKS